MGLPVEKIRPLSIEEYLRMENDSPEKHEYRWGEVLAMSGGTYEHSLITANLIRELGNVLKGKPCRVLEGNLRVRVRGKGLYSYPDVTVVCGPPQFDSIDGGRRTILNPKLIIEVQSPSTADYDRGDKFTQYRDIESLEEYVVVAQDRAFIEVFYRQDGGSWLFTPTVTLDGSARFRSIGVEVPLTEIYAGVEFPPPKPPPIDENRGREA